MEYSFCALLCLGTAFFPLPIRIQMEKFEGINNKIKVINRVAYNYRNCANYKKSYSCTLYMRPKATKNLNTFHSS